MGGEKLKVLLVGDASNCHNALAGGLRKLGHEVVVASDGTEWMDTDRDIDLSRRYMISCVKITVAYSTQRLPQTPTMFGLH